MQRALECHPDKVADESDAIKMEAEAKFKLLGEVGAPRKKTESLEIVAKAKFRKLGEVGASSTRRVITRREAHGKTSHGEKSQGEKAHGERHTTVCERTLRWA